MKIRTQFIFTSIMFAAILAGLGFAILFGGIAIQKTVSQSQASEAVDTQISELNYLSNDYLLYHEPQQLARWQAKYEATAAALAGISGADAGQNAIIDNLHSELANTLSVFSEARAALEALPVGQPADQAFIQLYWSRLEIQNQSMHFDSTRLTQLFTGHERSLRQTLTYLVSGMVLAFGLFLVANYLLNYRRILGSIAHLQVGAGIIGQGNLDYQVTDGHKDEVGQLAAAFNRMTADLKRVTASKAELEKEAEERKLAETALKQSEERFRVLTETTSVAKGVVSLAGGIFLYVNPAYEKAMGYTSEELLGNKAVNIFTDPADNETFARLLREHDHISNYEARLNRKDRTSFWAVISVSRLIFDGKPAWLASFNDITDRKQAEEALRASEARLARSQEIAHLGGWELDLICDRLTWSDEVYRIFGLLPQEFDATYEAFLSYVHPEDRQKVDSAYRNSLGAGCSGYEVEHRIVRKNTGEIRFVHEKCEHLRNAGGDIVRSVGMVHDVTERVKAEAQMAHLASFPALNPNPVVELDADGVITYSNRTAREQFPDLESKGSSHPFFKDWQAILAAMPGGSRQFSREFQIGGKWQWQTVSYVEDSGSLRFYSRDITQRVQAETSLAESEERLRLHTENSPLAIVEWDSDFVVTRWSGAAESMFGWTAGETLGKPIADLKIVYEPDVSIVNATMTQLTDGSTRAYTSSNRNLTRDGRVIWCTWYNSIIYDENGRMKSVMSQVQDITEHRRIDRAKDEFISLVSHELRNPLTVIIGSVQTALAPGLSGDEIRLMLQNAAEGGKSMERIISNLLELSRAQADRLKLDREKIDIPRLARQAIDQVKLLHPFHHYEIKESGDIPQVSADPVRIERILFNLVENAAKYSPPESPIKINITREGKELTVSVEDKGMGIPADRMGDMFEPFQRLVEQSTHAKGLGLGLVVCKRLVEAHGGRIWAESKEGCGTSFFFTLPIG